MAEPTDNQFEYKPLGESYDKPPTQEAIPGVKIPKSTSTMPDSGNAGGLASSSPSTPQYDYKPLYESYDKPPTGKATAEGRGFALPPSQKSKKTLQPEKPGIFKQAWEGTKEIGMRGLWAGQQTASKMAYYFPEAVVDVVDMFSPEKHQQTLPHDRSKPDYDMEGYIKKYGKPKTKEGAHLTDEFKNPSHISFSKESKYSKPGQEGGDWKYLDKSGNPLEENQPGGQWHFYASDFNLTQHTPEEMKSEFDRINKEDRKHGIPESVLHLPEEGLFDKFAKNIRETQEAISGMEKSQELQPTEYSDVSKHPISASLAGGARMLPQIALFALGPIGKAIGMTAFAVSGFKESYDKVYKSQLASGKSPEEAKQNAMIAGAITGAVYAFGGKYLSKGQGIASGLFRKALGKGAFTAEEVFTNAAGSEMAKGFAKSFGVGLGTTMAALAAYGTIPVAVERAFGVTGPEEPTVWEAFKGTIPSSVGLTIISSIFGLAARTKPFSDPRPNLKGKDAENYAKQRMAAVNAVALQLHKIDPKMAENFRWNSIAAINEGKPINLSAESLREPTAQPEPTGEPSAPTSPEQNIPLTPDQNESPEDELVQGKSEEYKNDLEDFEKAVSESPVDIRHFIDTQTKLLKAPEPPKPPEAMTAQDFKKANDQATAAKRDEAMQKLGLAKAGGLESPRPTISLPAIVPGGPAVDLTKMPTEANVLPPTDGSAGAPTDLTMPPTAPEETLPPSVKQQTPEDIVKQSIEESRKKTAELARQAQEVEPTIPVPEPAPEVAPVTPEPSPEPSAPKVSDKEKRVKAIDKSIDNLQKKIDSKIQEGYSAGRDKADIEAGASIRGMNDRIAKLRKEKSELSGEPSVPQGMQIGIEALQDALHKASSGEVATRITNLERRISKKPELETEAVKKLIQEAKDYLKSKGLEIQDVVKEGDVFDDGLTVKAEFQLTDSDIIGSEIISKITTQGLMKDGVLVSTPSIMVDADGRTLTYKQKREEIKAGKILYPDEPFVPEKTAEVPPQKESSKVNIVENNSFRGERRTSVMGPDDTQIVARNANGEDVSFLHYTKHEDGTISVRRVETLESEERKGYATELVKKAVADHGIIRGWTDTTPKGKAFFTKIAKSHPELMTPELAKSLLEPKKEEPTAQVKKEEVTPPVSEPSAPVEPKVEVAPEAPTPKEEAPSKPMTLDEAEDYARKAGYLVGDERLNPDMLSEVQEAIENDKLGMKPANSDIMGIINNAKLKPEAPAKEEQTAQEGKKLEGVTSKGGDIFVGNKLQFVGFPHPKFTVVGQDQVTDTERENGEFFVKVVKDGETKPENMLASDLMPLPEAKKETAQKAEPKKSNKVSTMQSLIASGVTELSDADIDNLYEWKKGEFTGKSKADVRKVFASMLAKAEPKEPTPQIKEEPTKPVETPIEAPKVEPVPAEPKLPKPPTAQSKPTTAAFDSLPQASKNMFNEAFESGNSEKMFQLLHKGNKILRAEFENRTGIKLPKTVWVPKAELEKWSATVEKPTAKPVDITKAKERIEEIDESIKGLNKQAEALKKRQRRSKYGSKLNNEMHTQLSENYDKVRVLSQEAEPLRKEIRSTYLHEVVEQGDEPNRMAAQEILDNQGVSNKTYDAIRNMVKEEIKSYGKIDDDVSSQTEDSVTSMITTSPKSDDANSLKKLVLNQLINRSDKALSDRMNYSNNHDMSNESRDALENKFKERINAIVSRETPQKEKVKLYAELLNDVDAERERLVAEDKKKSELESEKEKARDAAKEAEKTRKYPPTPSATEKPSDVRVMTKKPQEFTIPKTPQKLKEEFEAGKWLFVPDGKRDPFTYESSKPKSEETQKLYDKSWEAVLKGTVKKTKNGIRVESKKVRQEEGGEFAPTTYYDFLPIDTTPKTEELVKQEGITPLGDTEEYRAVEGRRAIRDIARADPEFAKNPRFTVALISKDDPKAGAWLVYNVSPEASKEAKTKRQYKVNPASISNALYAEIEEGNIKDGAIIELSPGYLEGKAGEIFAAKKGADTKALFSLANKPNIDRAIKILDGTYEKNIRIASAINKLQDMEKRGIISAEGSQQAIEMLNGMSRPVMPKSEVLDILRKGSYNVDTGTAGRSIGVEGTRGEGNASPEAQVPSASRKVVAGDVQDQRAKAGGQAVRAGDTEVGMGGKNEGVGEGLDKTLPVLSDTGQTEKDVSGAIGDPRRVMGQGNKMPDSIRANEGKISQDIADLREKSGNPDIEAAREITPTQTAAAEILSKAFSKRIVWVQANSKFDGVAIDASRIYLASHLSDAQSIMKTFGHELYHTIKNEGRVGSDILKTAGETFERDIRTAIPEKTFVRFTDWRNKENIKIGWKEQTPDELWEEYGGYVLGDAIRDPRFYENLQRQSPSSFRKFVDWIVDAFRKMGFISEKAVASNYYEPDKAERLIKSSSDLIKTYLESRPKEITEPKLEEPKLSLATERQWKSILSRQRDIEGLQPAIKNTDTGDIQSSKFGDTHEDLRRNAPKGQKYISGFIDRNGDFFSRDEAEKKWGIRGLEDIYNALYINNPNERTDFTPEEEKVNAHDARVFYSLFSHEFDPNNPPDIKGNDIEAHAKNALETVRHMLTPGLDAGKAIAGGLKTLIAPTSTSPEHLGAAEDLAKHLGAMNRRQEITSEKIDGKLGEFGKHEKSLSGFFDTIGVFDDSKPLEENPGMLFGSDMSQGRFEEMSNPEINKRYGTTELQANRLKEAARVVEEEFQSRLAELERAGAPLERVRENYFPGMWTPESIRAFNQAMGEYLESHPGSEKGLEDWTKDEKEEIKSRVSELLKTGKGSDIDQLAYLARRPFKGRETYRKPKSFDDIMTAVEFGLHPVTTNPLDLVKLKLAELDRGIMANGYINNTAKPKGDIKFLAIGKEMPEGFMKVNDKYGTVYGPPTMKTEEFVDRNVYEGLSNVVASLGIQHERKWSAGRGKLGWASREEGGQIVTQFATELSVMAHEIGHKLDTKYDLWDKLVAGAEGIGKRGEVTKTASAEKRATIQNELRTLADLSWEGSEASPAYKKKVRKKEEKMAHLLEAYIHARDKFEQVAPTLFEDFDAFIRSKPELKELADIRQGLSLKKLTGEKSLGGFPIIGNNIAKMPVAQVLNNYLSSSLYNNQYFGKAYQATMEVSNLLNQSQLSVFSAFHVGFTSADVSISANANILKDIYGIVKGNRTMENLAKSISYAPQAIIKTPMEGAKILNEWAKPTMVVPTNIPVRQLQNRVAVIAKAAEMAGAGFTMEQGLRTQQTDKMFQDWYAGNKVRAALRSPVALIEFSSKPIMEWLVPKQKAGVFGQLVGRLIEQNPTKTLDNLLPQIRQAWNRVDARLGQVRYDRLFLNNSAKNVIQASVRAPGWSGGTIAEIGGALKDTAKFISDWVKTGKAPEELPDRVAYTMSLLITASAINGALTYAFTGDQPKDMDYWAFRTGENDEQGRPVRFLLPTYEKDIFAYWRHPGKTLLAKTHPMLGALSDLLIRNADYYGVEIRHTGDNPLEQAGQVAKYAIKQFEPFWMRGIEKQTQSAGHPATLAGALETVAENPLKALGPELGVMPASAEYLNTPAQNTMRDILQGRTPKSEKTQAQADIYNLKRQLRGRLQQTGDTEEIHQAVLDGKITSKEARDIIKSKNVPPLVREFKQLEPEEAITVYELGNEVERKELKPLLNKKMRTALKNKTPEERKRIMAIYNEMMESENETST